MRNPELRAQTIPEMRGAVKTGQRSCVEGDRYCLPGLRLPGEKVARHLLELLERHGPAQDATVGCLMRGLGWGQTEQVRELDRPHLNPLGDAMQVIPSSQFRDHDAMGQDGRQAGPHCAQLDN